MSITQDVNAISVAQTRILKCPGVTLDLTPATTGRTLYTITGDPIIVFNIYGVCSTAIGGGAARPFLQLTPIAAYGAAALPICALHATIAALNAGDIVCMTGVAIGVLTTQAVTGIHSTNEATGLWGGDTMTMVPGVIQIVNTVSAVSGIIDWYLDYQPCSPACRVTVR